MPIERNWKGERVGKTVIGQTRQVDARAEAKTSSVRNLAQATKTPFLAAVLLLLAVAALHPCMQKGKNFVLRRALSDSSLSSLCLRRQFGLIRKASATHRGNALTVSYAYVH